MIPRDDPNTELDAMDIDELENTNRAEMNGAEDCKMDEI